MNTGSRVGVILASVAAVLWLVVGASVLLTPAEEGANIGAALVGILGMGLSIAAAAFLIISADHASVKMAAIVSIAAWALFVTLTLNSELPDTVGFGLAGSAILALCVSAGLAIKKPSSH